MIEENKGKIFLFDTNILVYAFDKSEYAKHKIASQLLFSYIESGNKFALSTQNLAEFFSIVTTKIKIPLDKTEAKSTIQEFIELENCSILQIKPSTIILGCEICANYNIDFWDSLLIATMKENGIFNIYTENIKDFKVPWINALNPFKK